MDCLDQFIAEMRVLERGWRVWSAHHQRFVVVFGRLFMNIADFPAAQELSGSRGISALHPCRLCLALKGTYAAHWTLRLNENPVKDRDWMLTQLEKYKAELDLGHGHKGKAQVCLTHLFMLGIPCRDIIRNSLHKYNIGNFEEGWAKRSYGCEGGTSFIIASSV